MHDRYFLYLLIILFFLSSVWLTVKQESLLDVAGEDFVSLAFVDPRDSLRSDFMVTHDADTPRTITLRYRYENNQEEIFSETLAPRETKIFKPENTPLSITISYTDSNNQLQEISLTKK